MKPLTEADLRRLAGLPEKQINENSISDEEVKDILYELKDLAENDEYLEMEFMENNGLDITSHPRLQRYWMGRRRMVAEYLERMLQDFVTDRDTSTGVFDDVAIYSRNIYKGYNVIFNKNPITPKIKQFIESNKTAFTKKMLMVIKETQGKSELFNYIFDLLDVLGINWPDLNTIKNSFTFNPPT